MRKEKTYESLWKLLLPAIRIQIKNSRNGPTSISMNEVDFKACGNREDYTFGIQINHGKANVPSGNVVGDNLYAVLMEDIKIKELISNRTLKLTMDDFILRIELT